MASVDDRPLDFVDDVIAQANAMATQQATGAAPRQELPGNNPLDQFASYTYNISLAALSPDEYNQLLKKPDISFAPRNVVISSAARQGAGYTRNQFFDREFYIQNLKFETIVGLNAASRASNVISLKMEIVEPMGLSLFDRLLRLAQDLKYENFIDIPYLLIIDFVGYDDNGVPQRKELAEHRKFIPIKIIASNMKVNTNGSVYVMEAIPYNHIAFLASDTGGSVPLNLQIKCQTVSDFFTGNSVGNLITDSDSVITEFENRNEAAREYERKVTALQGEFNTTPVRDWLIVRQFNANLVSLPVKAGSFASALNAYESYINQQKLAQRSSQYNFRIDNEISQAKIVDKPNIKTTLIPMVEATAKTFFSNVDAGSDNKEFFGVSAGTNIIEVINSVIKNSTYITQQLNTSNGQTTRPNSPRNWYKITPQVEVSDYDRLRETYSKKITYIIDKYVFHNTKSDGMAITHPSKFLLEYNYIFTGKNTSILDLQIEYDALFSVIASSSNQKGSFLTSDVTPVTGLEHINIFDSTRYGENVTPKRTTVKSGFPEQRGTDAESQATTIQTSDFFNNILNVSPDMMGVTMKIVGDPRYIKQDDVFYNSGNSNIRFGDLLSQNNSVLFDYEERYIKLNFKTPLDYDNATGLLDGNDKFVQSKFSGLYRVLRIENTFSRGKFEQTLDLVRLFLQDENGVPLKDRLSTEPVNNTGGRE
jgi:hypothetical protein